MRRAFALCLAVLLAACTNDVTVTHNYIPQRGVPGHADYAAALGPVPVVMANSPYPPPAVLAALSTHNSRPHVFTASPPASLEGGYRLILAFNQRAAAGLYVCRGPFRSGAPAAAPAPGTPPPTTTSVYGAFCLGPSLLSEAIATAPRVERPDDPMFARQLGDLLSALMPYRDPYEEGGFRRCLIC